MTDRYANMINDGCPERIWIEREGGCPYFYHEDELSDVAPPITEYVRADKLEELAAEVERLRAEVEVWRASFEQAAAGHATYAERTEQLAKVLIKILENEAPSREVAEKYGGYVLDNDLRKEARAALGEGEWK